MGSFVTCLVKGVLFIREVCLSSRLCLTLFFLFRPCLVPSKITHIHCSFSLTEHVSQKNYYSVFLATYTKNTTLQTMLQHLSSQTDQNPMGLLNPSEIDDTRGSGPLGDPAASNSIDILLGSRFWAGPWPKCHFKQEHPHFCNLLAWVIFLLNKENRTMKIKNHPSGCLE